MENFNILGIDPGLTGGMVCLSKDRDILFKCAFRPIGKQFDLSGMIQALKDCIYEHQPSFAFLEKVSSMPQQGVSSTFKFGQVFGGIEAALVTVGQPYILVTPQSWSKEIHKGVDKRMKAKDKSRILLQRLYPHIDLRENDKCKVPHDGMMDALLIAEYGVREIKGGI